MADLDMNQIQALSSNLRAVSDMTYPAIAAIADEYNASSAYNIGEYCIRNGLLYKCNTAIVSGGEPWTAAHWTQINITDELSGNIGVPSGGTAGQVLAKNSATDYATEWATPQSILPVVVVDYTYDGSGYSIEGIKGLFNSITENDVAITGRFTMNSTTGTSASGDYYVIGYRKDSNNGGVAIFGRNRSGSLITKATELISGTWYE